VNDTIFALATPPGRGAVAVLRLSGPGTAAALAGLGAGDLAPRRASLRALSDPGESGQVLDQGLVLWFPGPASYTGEDGAELHLHGGRAVVEAVSSALVALGLRPAEPGEFTRRAFQNGKLDLAQAEAVADLVEAETAAQRRQALDQLEGALGRRYDGWRGELIELLAWLEAEIDFPDEDLPGGLATRVGPRLAGLLHEIDAALVQDARGLRVRDGFPIALIGAPNAGKSSFFNWLMGRDAAIVAATAGTTRDVIEGVLTLEGYKVVVADMAGLRATDHDIEAEGVRRARAWAEGAALRIWIVDGSGAGGAWREAADLVRPGDLLVVNKNDEGSGPDAAAAAESAARRGLGVFHVSVTKGGGLETLRTAVTATVVSALAGADFPATTRARHRFRLQEARVHLDRALSGLDLGAELAAEDLRLAARAFGRVSGRVDAEDVLDVVFASFCIGK
jgi:tRNA modification GTPase